MTSTIIIIILRCRGGYGRRRYIQTLMDQITTINSSTATETAAYANTYVNKSWAAIQEPRDRTMFRRGAPPSLTRRWSGRARRWTLPLVPMLSRDATWGSMTISCVGGAGSAAGRVAIVASTIAVIVVLSVCAVRGNDNSMEGPGSQ